MNNNHQVPGSSQEIAWAGNTGAMEEQIVSLMQWKEKARVQLEYFHLACKLYNLCDTEKLTELLRN